METKETYLTKSIEDATCECGGRKLMNKDYCLEDECEGDEEGDYRLSCQLCEKEKKWFELDYHWTCKACAENKFGKNFYPQVLIIQDEDEFRVLLDNLRNTGGFEWYQEAGSEFDKIDFDVDITQGHYSYSEVEGYKEEVADINLVPFVADPKLGGDEQFYEEGSVGYFRVDESESFLCHCEPALAEQLAGLVGSDIDNYRTLDDDEFADDE